VRFVVSEVTFSLSVVIQFDYFKLEEEAGVAVLGLGFRVTVLISAGVQIREFVLCT